MTTTTQDHASMAEMETEDVETDTIHPSTASTQDHASMTETEREAVETDIITDIYFYAVNQIKDVECIMNMTQKYDGFYRANIDKLFRDNPCVPSPIYINGEREYIKKSEVEQFYRDYNILYARMAKINDGTNRNIRRAVQRLKVIARGKSEDLTDFTAKKIYRYMIETNTHTYLEAYMIQKLKEIAEEKGEELPDSTAKNIYQYMIETNTHTYLEAYDTYMQKNQEPLN